jgi:hypothetical protein
VGGVAWAQWVFHKAAENVGRSRERAVSSWGWRCQPLRALAPSRRVVSRARLSVGKSRQTFFADAGHSSSSVGAVR